MPFLINKDDEFRMKLYGVSKSTCACRKPESFQMRRLGFNDYQKECAKTDVGTAAQDILSPGWLYYVLGIAGETGELMEKIKKLFRDKKGEIDAEFKEAVIKEMGDVMWYMARLCSWFDIDFRTVALTNVEKLQRRKSEGTIHGDGDDR